MSYSYRDSVKQDVLDYIKENILEDYVTFEDFEADKDNLREQLRDDLWVEDSVTGNGSGSYTFDRERAKSYVNDSVDGWDTFSDAVSDFDISAKEIGNKLKDQDWEYFDVTIRCYLLGQAIDEALDSIDSSNFDNPELIESTTFTSEKDANLFFAAQRAYNDGYRYYDIEDNDELKQDIVSEYLEREGLDESDLPKFLDTLLDLEDRFVYGIKR